jgi:hypothetical protein
MKRPRGNAFGAVPALPFTTHETGKVDSALVGSLGRRDHNNARRGLFGDVATASVDGATSGCLRAGAVSTARRSRRGSACATGFKACVDRRQLGLGGSILYMEARRLGLRPAWRILRALAVALHSRWPAALCAECVVYSRSHSRRFPLSRSHRLRKALTTSHRSRIQQQQRVGCLYPEPEQRNSSQKPQRPLVHQQTMK